ncbi:unnamed protein product [Rotaria sp. Silwood1]|nr:unnamed protein product [Rotaria sp. Silwood1]
MACTSTTISSNVVMTKNAMGNEYSALLNAALGNVLGIFISPALVFYFMSNPIVNSLSSSASSGKSSRLDYGNVMKNLGLTVLLPLFVGQVIHFLWTKQVAYVREKFHFSELNSLALLALVWSVFCTAVATESFHTINGKDLAALIIINAGIYIIFSLLIMITARIPIRYWQFSREDTVAIMFCGATKTVAMGVPLINILYTGGDQEVIGLLSLPLIMYHVEQLILGAIEALLLKKWVTTGIKKQSTMTIKESNQDNNEHVDIKLNSQVSMDQLEQLLLKLVHLTHLELYAIGYNDLADGNRWLIMAKHLRVSSISSKMDMIRLIDGFKYLSDASFMINSKFGNIDRSWYFQPEKLMSDSRRLSKDAYTCRLNRLIDEQSSITIQVWIGTQTRKPSRFIQWSPRRGYTWKWFILSLMHTT